MKLQSTGWRGEGSAPWCVADDQLLTEALALGFTAPDIGVLLGRSAGAVRLRRDKLARRSQEAAEEQCMAARRRTRPCMRCSNPFESEGSHNRLCDPCRAFANGLSPMAPDDGLVDDDDAEAAEDDAHAAPPPTVPRDTHPWRRRHSPAAAAGRGQSGPSHPPGDSKVQGKRAAPAAPAPNVTREFSARIRIDLTQGVRRV